MSNSESIRAAAYLATQQRLDLKGKLKCNPPNRECGDRCIPPSWKCRVKGEGSDSHSRVVAGDPLAGAASIARGRARLAKGLRTGNVAEIQAGRAAIARGFVKAVPGQNLKDKQQLRKRVESAIVPIATGLFAMWAIRQGHEGAKVLFPAYAKGPAQNIETAAGTAVGFMLDRVPIYGGYRQAQRRNAALQAQVIGRAVRIGTLNNPDVAANNARAFEDVSRQKVAGLRDAIRNGLNVRDENGRVTRSYLEFRSNLLSNVLGANANGRSLYAEPAAVNYLARQYGIRAESLRGADNTARKSFLITQVAGRLSDAATSMRRDMTIRGLDYKKQEDVERYVEIAGRNARQRFTGLSTTQQTEAFSNFAGTVRELVSPSSSPTPHRKLANRLYDEAVSSYDEYFKQAAQRIREDTSPTLRVLLAQSADSPLRSALVGVAERVKGRVRITAPIAGANHAELVLQRVYHEAAVTGGYRGNRRNAMWQPSDSDIKYAAQDLGWDGQGGVSSAYSFIQRSGQFPNLATRPSDVRGTRTRRTLSEGEAVYQLMQQNPGMTLRAARLEVRRRRGDSQEPALARTATYLAMCTSIQAAN